MKKLINTYFEIEKTEDFAIIDFIFPKFIGKFYNAIINIFNADIIFPNFISKALNSILK